MTDKKYSPTNVFLTAIALLVAFAVAQTSRAATLTWTGAGGDNNVSNALNWSPAQAPVTGDVLVFAGAAGLAPQFGTALTVGTITFNSTAQAFTLGGSGTLTVNAGITNSSAITETINTALILGGSQNWTATAGNLVIGGAVNLQSFTVTNNGGKLTTINGAISGTGGVTQNGKGKLTLNGSSSYSGTTTLRKGTLTVGSNSALGTGLLITAGTGKLDAGGGAWTIPNAFQIDNSFTFLGSNGLTVTGPASVTTASTLTANGTGQLTLSGVLSGTRTLTKAGTGTLGLYGASGAAFSGALTINAGRLVVGNTGATGTGTLTLGTATIEAAGAARTVSNAITISGSPTFAGAYDLTFSGAPSFGAVRTLAVNNPTTTFSGIITGGTSGIIKTGAGMLVLSGANGYGAGTVLRNGTVVLDSNTAAGAATGTITVGDSTAGTTTPATLLFSATAGRTVANPFSVPMGSTGLRTIGGLNTAGVNTFSGTVTLGTGITVTEGAGGEVNFTGVVSGAGGIIKTGAGTVRLTNTNTFSGETLVSAGTLAYGASNAIGTGAVTIDGGVLDMGASRTDSVGAVTLETGSILGTGTSALTSTAGFTVRSGTISAILAGSVALTKDTAGTVTLSGANSFTGGTNVNAGTLAFGASNVLADSGALNVSGGMLSIGAYTDTVGVVTLASGSILGTAGGVLTGASYTLQSGTVSAALGGAGITLTKNTTGTVLISGANTYTGATTISAGTLRLGVNDTLSSATALTVASGATLDFSSFNDTIGSLAGAGSVLLGSGRITTGGNNTATTFSGALSGTGGVTKAGTGIFTLSGTSAYSGSTDVNVGTLTLGVAAASPSASRVNVANGATFNVAGFSATIGSLAGAGSVTLGAGTLNAGGDGTASTFSGVLSGTGGLVKSGVGSMKLTGTNMLSGSLTVNGGSLVLQGTAGRAISASSVSIRSGGILILDNSAGENADRIGNSAAINMDGGDLQFISGPNGSSETAGAFNLLSGQGNITVVHNGSAAQSTILTFASVNSVAPGASVNFASSGGALGVDSTGPQIYITGRASGLLGSWARVGADFAEYSTNGVRAFSAYYTGSLGINVNDPTKIVLLNSSAPLSAYTLTNAGTTNDGGLSLTDLALVDLNTSATRVLNLTGGGLIKNGLPDTVISGAGALTANGTAAGAFNISVESAKLTIASRIIDNAGTDGIYGNAGDGSISIVKAGAGTLSLSGANTFSGGIFINEGTIEIGADAHLGATGNDVAYSGGTLRVVSGFTAGAGRRFSVAAGLTGTMEIAAGQALTINAASDLLATSSTASRLVKTGAGDLILGAANPNFTGTLEIVGGAAELRHADALGVGAQSAPIALNGGTLRLRADTNTSFSNPFQILADSAIEGAPVTSGTPVLSLGALSIGGRTLALAANGGAILSLAGVTLTGGATFNATAGTTTLGSVSGAYGFTKTGAGMLQLTAAGSYSGSTSVQGGTLRLGTAGAIPLSSLVNVGPAGIVDLNSLSVNFGAIAGSGAITLGTGTLTLGGDLATSTFGGVISGSGGLVTTGAETLTLSGANSYTGATSITSGSIRLAAHNALPAATAVSIASGAALDLAGYNQTIASVSGSGTVSLGAGTLTTGSATDTTFTGNFTGSGGVVKTGAGKLSLSGASSLSGPINVAAGTLEILSPAALSASTGATSVSTGARLTLATGITVASEPLILAGSGPAGGGALELASGTSSWNGPITLTIAGTVGSGGTLSLGGAITLAGQTFTFTGSGDTTVTGSISGTGAVRKTGSGTLTLAQANGHAGATTVVAGRLRIQDSAALGASGSGNETDVQDGGTLMLDSAGGIAANESILLAGSGAASAGAIWAAKGDNSFTGPVLLTADATVTVDAATSLSLGDIGDLGLGRNLTKNGAGLLTLAGANTFTGTLIVAAGTVATTADARFNGLSGLSLAAGTTLDLNDFSDSIAALSGAGTISFGPLGGGVLTVGARGTNTTFSGVLSGTGDLVKTGAGTLSIATSGAIPAAVSVSVEGGTLDLGATNQTTAPVVVTASSLTGTGILTALGTGSASGFTYELRGGTVSARLAGTGSTLLASEGYNTLSSINTYTGATQVSAGTLDIAPTGALSNTSGVTVAAGAVLHNRGTISSGIAVSGTLSGTGSTTGAVTVASTGIVSPGTDSTVGTFATGALSLASGSTYRLTLDTSSTLADKIAATGSISLGSGIATLAATDIFTTTLLHGTTFTILQSTTGVSGFFAGLPQGAFFMIGVNNYQISYLANSSRNVTISVVPEPSPALLLICSIGMLRLLRPRRRQIR